MVLLDQFVQVVHLHQEIPVVLYCQLDQEIHLVQAAHLVRGAHAIPVVLLVHWNQLHQEDHENLVDQAVQEVLGVLLDTNVGQ